MADLFEEYPFARAWDEMFSAPGQIRPAYESVFAALQTLDAADLKARADIMGRTFLDQGITFALGGVERPFPLDLIPRIVTAAEWRVVETGVPQRIRALEAFLADVYGQGKIFADGVVMKLRVTDDSGGTTVLAQTVRVTRAPVASFTATPNPVSLHEDVTFDGSGSSDPDGPSLAKYEWDLDGNGTYEADSGTNPIVLHAYHANGTVVVKLRVTDADGATATHSVSVVASNGLPVASLTVSPNPVAAGAPVLLDARGSSDSDGTIVKYDWDLDGNGSFETTTGATATRSHTYPNAATFNVGVKVTDDDGGTRTTSRQLVVTGDPSGGETGSGGGSGGEAAGSGTGTGSAGGTGTGAGSGGDAGTRFAGRLTGSPIQRLRSVLLRGLAVGCQSDRRVTCVLRAELRASDARRLGFRSRTGRAISLGSVRFVASRVGRGAAHLKLTSAGKRILRRARRVSVVVRGTVTGDGGKVTASRNFLLRR